jgi:hypothetical protein
MTHSRVLNEGLFDRPASQIRFWIIVGPVCATSCDIHER